MSTWNTMRDMWNSATEENWLDRLVAREAAAHEMRKTKWNNELFVKAAELYGREWVHYWECRLLLRFSALPITGPHQGADVWWRIKPCDWFYHRVAAKKVGRIVDDRFQPDREVFELLGEIVLIDTRRKPIYKNGRQMWEFDEHFCGRVLKQLRKSGDILRYKHGSQKSRFGVDAGSSWREHFRPELAKLLNLDPFRVRLERVVEANAISQFYSDLPRTQDDTTDTWVWCEEYFEDANCRLFSNGTADSGRTAVEFGDPDLGRSDRSFRPLAVLAP